VCLEVLKSFVRLEIVSFLEVLEDFEVLFCTFLKIYNLFVCEKEFIL